MELKNFFAQDRTGNVIPSPKVYLYQSGTTALVGNLKDAAGNALANPFNGTSDGQITVAAPDGSYDMRIVGSARDATIPVRFIDSTAASADLLRQDLASEEEGKGPDLIAVRLGTHRTLGDKLPEFADLRDFGAVVDGASDCWPAILLALANGYQNFRLRYVPGESDTAYFSAYDASGVLVGKTVDVDPRITLSVPDNAVVGDPNSMGVRYVQQTRFYLRSLNTYYSIQADFADLHYGKGRRRVMPLLDAQDAERSRAIAITAATLRARSIVWNSAEDWDDESFSTVGPASFTFDPAPDSRLRFGFAPCKPGDEFVCAFAASGLPLIAACVRHTNGYAGVWSDADYTAGPLTHFEKDGLADGTNGEMSFPFTNRHGSYSGLGSIWTIRIDSWQSFSILLNGYVVRRLGTSGVITEAGFGGYLNAAGQSITVNDLVRVRGARQRGAELVSVRVYGDSKTADRYDAWPHFLKDCLEFSAGLRCWKVTNRAIAGHGAWQQRAIMEVDDLSDCNGVIIDIGTNDAQGQRPIEDFRADLIAMIDRAQQAGRWVIVGVPSLWYTRTQAGERGQASMSYDKVAPYRSAAIRIAAEKGCRHVDNTRYDGPVLANYVNPSPQLGVDLTTAGDPVVYDNIHPTTESNKRRALAYAKAVLAHYADKSGSLYLPPHPTGTSQNGWVTTIQPPLATVSAGGDVQFYGVVNDNGAAVHTDGVLIFVLPEYLTPPAEIRVPCVVQNPTERVYIAVSPDRRVTAYGATTSTWIDLSGIRFNIENREVL